jgi:dolichol-phosphate mannosyltransferase
MVSAAATEGNVPPEVLLSIVVPVYNEEGSVGDLVEEIDRAFAPVDYRWETVWVNDGSKDGTLERLKGLGAPHRYVALDGNYGQSAALRAGFSRARGAWVGTLDGDGQNDPADLPRLLEKARQTGVDMVNGYRARRHDNVLRRISSRVANAYRNRKLKETVRDVGCSTRVVRREVLLELPFFHGMHRFLPALVRMRGYSIDEMPVNHRPREAGKSKYGLWNRLIPGMRDLKGVRWLMSRQRVWKIAEEGGKGDAE